MRDWIVYPPLAVVAVFLVIIVVVVALLPPNQRQKAGLVMLNRWSLFGQPMDVQPDWQVGHGLSAAAVA